MSEMGILSQLSLKTVSISLHEVSWDLDFLLRVVVPPRRSCRCLPGSHWKVSGAKRRLVTVAALGSMADHGSRRGGRRVGQAVFSPDGSMSAIAIDRMSTDGDQGHGGHQRIANIRRDR